MEAIGGNCVDMTNLKRLREVTDRISLAALVHPGHGEDTVIEYAVDEGMAIGVGLSYREGECATQRVSLSKGTKFRPHVHEKEHEYVITTVGKWVLYLMTGAANDEESGEEQNPTDCAYIPPGVKHRVDVLEDTRIICVTVPAARGYPRARY